MTSGQLRLTSRRACRRNRSDRFSSTSSPPAALYRCFPGSGRVPCRPLLDRSRLGQVHREGKPASNDLALVKAYLRRKLADARHRLIVRVRQDLRYTERMPPGRSERWSSRKAAPPKVVAYSARPGRGREKHPANRAARGDRAATILQRARVGQRALKDLLRDTYASQLLTARVQLGYVSRQLGHSDVAVTARPYARWAGVTPIARRWCQPRVKSLPTCLRGLASPTTYDREVWPNDGDSWIRTGMWRAGRDSDPRPSGSKYELAPRSDAELRLRRCEGLQGAAPGCTCDGSRLYPAPTAALAG